MLSSNNQVLNEITAKLGIWKRNTVIFNPKNNLIERSHRTLNQYLKAFVSSDQSNWHEMLPYAVYAINNNINVSTNFEPHTLVYNFVNPMPTNVTKNTSNSYNYDSLFNEFKTRL
jgi:hypothetical protein